MSAQAGVNLISTRQASGNRIKLLYLTIIVLFFLSSCNLSIYHVNAGTDSITRKDVYSVTYSTAVPDGTTAVITYLNSEGESVKIANVTGKWENNSQYRSGQDMFFKVVTKLPDSFPQKKLATAIAVDGKVFAEQIQTGKNVKFRVKFKLP